MEQMTVFAQVVLTDQDDEIPMGDDTISGRWLSVVKDRAWAHSELHYCLSYEVVQVKSAILDLQRHSRNHRVRPKWKRR
jgi:hypothetical protein